jgi:sigma-B regulation protein RsbU (phosphoserine phosphatase)
MSLFLGLLDPARKTLTYASAGHSAPLWLRAGGTIDELPPTGPVLGPFPDATYRARGPVTLARGDAVVLFTDGIYEAQGPSDEMYGEERLQRSLVAHAAKTVNAQALLQGLYADLAAYTGARPLADDATCLVLRVT